MKIDEALNQDLAIKNNRLPLKVILDNTDNNITNFIENINTNIESELINATTTLIEQLLGHFNQLLVKYGDGVRSRELEELITKKEALSQEFTNNKTNLSSKQKITVFKTTYNQLKDIYDTLVIEINKSLTNSENVTEYNNLVKQANASLDRLKDKDIDIDTINELLTLYKNISNNINALANLETLIAKIQLLLTTPDNNKGYEINSTAKVFDLFAKINDQIISSAFNTKDNLIYAIYKLEDQSNYLAITKKEEEIKILEQIFLPLPNLVLTKDNIINTCRIIIKNAGIYYDINEFMRYVEMSYKTKMTKEIDQIIANYKMRLTNLETILKSQLTFIDNIALLVNKRPCPDYPNITYTDVPLNNFFLETTPTSSTEKEVERLIVNVMLNPDVKTTFDTKSILKTLYDDKILKDLQDISLDPKETTPLVDTTNLVTNEIIPTTQELITNSTKLSSYLVERLNELNLLKNSSKINITLTRDNNPLFKDINTVLDINTAIVICDKVYKEGQGLFAVKDYLKTGELLRFTSKYQARSLVENTDRVNYIRLLLDSMIKDYSLNKSKPLTTNFIKDYLLQDDFNFQTALQKFLGNDDLLEEAITNYNYQYLDSLSNDAKSVKELLSSNNTNLEKINNLLVKIKKISL